MIEQLVLRTAMTHLEAVVQAQRIFDEQIKPSILAVLGEDPDAELRAALIMTQTVGVIVCRYLFGLEPIASADPEVLGRAVQDAIILHATRPMWPVRSPEVRAACVLGAGPYATAPRL